MSFFIERIIDDHENETKYMHLQLRDEYIPLNDIFDDAFDEQSKLK